MNLTLVVFIFIINFTLIFCEVDVTSDSNEEEGNVSVFTNEFNDEENDSEMSATKTTSYINSYSLIDERNVLSHDNGDGDVDEEDIMQADEPFLETTSTITDISSTPLVVIDEVNSEATQEMSITVTEETTTEESGTPEGETSTLSTSEATTIDEFQNFFDSETSTSETVTEAETTETTTQLNNISEQNKIKYVNKLSDQIRNVLLKYKQTGNVIVPDVPIPDPLSIPDMEKKISLATMNFKNQTVHGLSNFTIQHINTDLEKMQVYVMLHMDKLEILGDYNMRSFINRASGRFNVTLLNVTTDGAAALHYTPEGFLEASETDMDMSFQDIKLDFKNLGYMGHFFQGVVGAVGSIIFEGIKPVILTEVNTNVRKDINAKLKTMSNGIKINSTMNPVDQAIFEGRSYIKNQGYDPYYLSNFSQTLGIFSFNITQFYLTGLSRFYRVGGIKLSMDNGTVEFEIHLATDKLHGACQWIVGFENSPKILRKGQNSITVDHLQMRAIVSQSLDLSQRPKLVDLDFLLGNVELKTRREDTIDFAIEKVINNLPILLRHIIVDGLEEPVKDQVQKILSEVDVEKIVDKQLPNIDKLGV